MNTMSYKKILCVDDNDKNIKIYNELFDGEYDMYSAISGEECMDMVHVIQPDLILMDVMMTGIDGFEATKRIKSNPATAHIRVILVSARSALEDRLQGYESGADGYLCKPFDLIELREIVKSHLKLKSIDEVNSIKDQLTMLIAHELRTPLNGIVGNVSYLSTLKDVPSEIKECLSEIAKCTERLHDFSDKALLMIQLSSLIETELSLNCINDVVKDVIEEVKVVGERKECFIELIEHSEHSFLMNKDLVGFALEIVLKNALDYSYANSKVQVVVRHSGNVVNVIVSDHGTGVSTKQLNELFDLYSVSDVMHHDNGVGLSLSVAKKIVNCHGGDVSACHTEGGGLTVNFSFNIAERA